MASSLVQFRADSAEKLAAMRICQQLGLDLPSYLRMCLSRLVREKGIPFSMKIEDADVNPGVLAMQRASRIAKEHGISDMSLDEINAEIAAVRNCQ
ncbi:MAG: type II toxin-antitoxin system RelB/DinJ family antitoxin [bacterium]|nr:type II toxin-antitoxin system RelB/DinJ family antitoxin [bacterium]